jgi:D-3-phosphoglycerate dehydrogenase
MKPGVLLLNTARAELVELTALLEALKTGQVGGYGTDVLEEEPPPPDHPLLRHPKVIVTPHVASRTFESVSRQAMRALLNLINFFKGDPDVIQANK